MTHNRIYAANLSSLPLLSRRRSAAQGGVDLKIIEREVGSGSRNIRSGTAISPIRMPYEVDGYLLKHPFCIVGILAYSILTGSAMAIYDIASPSAVKSKLRMAKWFGRNHICRKRAGAKGTRC